mgnify:CR=1 FL=1
MKIAINGFGRVGRAVFRIALEKKINIVAINDIHGIEDAAYLLKYDSVYGNYKGKISIKGNNLIVDGKKIQVIQETDPAKLPWGKLKVDIVVESTGAFKERGDLLKHIQSGAKRVLITRPLDDPDVTILPGVNNKDLKKSHKLVSSASCTTNAVAPIVKVINEKLGIKKSLFTAIKGYTSSQNLLDGANKRDKRRGRSAAVNMVPTTTGASKAVVKVLPELKGKINGLSVRVPVPDGSLADIVIELKKPASVEEVNAILKESAKKEMKGIIEYSKEGLVSMDIIRNSHSAIVDSLMTYSKESIIKILAWYDNEHGYSSRVVDLIKMMSKQ